MHQLVKIVGLRIWRHPIFSMQPRLPLFRACGLSTSEMSFRETIFSR